MKLLSAHRILIVLSLILMTRHAVFASDSNADYILGPGDVLSVKDNNGEITKAPVLPDGTAVVNNAGVIKAAGVTIQRVNELVNEAAKKWFSSPHVEVTLERRRLEQVYVLGAVKHPGLYSVKEKTAESANSRVQSEDPTVSKVLAKTDLKSRESFTVSTVLETAGGLKENADIRHLHVTRLHPKCVINVDLWALMHSGDKKEDLVLEPGDVIYVPIAGTESGISDTGVVRPVGNKIRVIGAVIKPGLLEVPKGGIDLLTVIARAGGLSQPDSRPTIIVARTAEDGHFTTEHVVWNRKVSRMLEPGDIVVVKQRQANDYKISGSTFSNYGGYGSSLRKHTFHSPTQIEERRQHCAVDIDNLWRIAQHQHHGATTKDQIEAAYNEFESSLQKAADELDTGEPLKSDWATELIAYYTRPHHKWPAVSPTLDKVLEAREKLVQFTTEQVVASVERKLYRFAPIEDKSSHSSPNVVPPLLKR
ncbi:MAG: SLBB domain-containing protein [Cyanobacteria bacterium SZAS-4]|nr:SLBB domain-containing protein [Cyanobacteria bacterium SZAS-4]